MHQVLERAAQTETVPQQPPVIDCDVHAEVPRVEALFPYLPLYWVEHIQQSVFKGPTDAYYPRHAPVTARPGSIPEKGPAGSSLELLQQQVLDHLGVERAILVCTYAVDSLHNPDAAVAFASAVNDWLIAEWLEKDAPAGLHRRTEPDPPARRAGDRPRG
ncbi:MAG: hypothetical protein C4289_12070 [Chloroflexota bacterium]